jgi:RNA recognition motif-containing protein
MSHKGHRGAPYVKKSKAHDDDKYSTSEGKGGKERPTRTLFVRNISYNVSENEVYEIFAKFGELKRFFNLIEKRGMAFVTYVRFYSI